MSDAPQASTNELIQTATEEAVMVITSMDYFTKPQPIRQTVARGDTRTLFTSYRDRLEHAVLVVMTDTYAISNNFIFPYAKQVYPEATRIEARATLSSFFTAISGRAATGAYYNRETTNKLLNTIYSIICHVRGVTNDLRYGSSMDRDFGKSMSKILRTLMGSALLSVAVDTEYAQPALMWELLYGSCSTSAHLALNTRRKIIKDLLEHADNDRDECEMLLADSSYVQCEDCDNWAHEDSIHDAYGSESVCSVCIESGNWRWSEYYSQHVRDNNARWGLDPDGDETIFHEDDDNFSYDDDEDVYVHYRFSGRKPQLLGSYHSRARVGNQPFLHSVWTRVNDRFMGVELEVEVKDGDIDSHVIALNNKLNDGEVGKRVYFEADGSLTNGFEIITNPMGLDAHYNLWSAFAERDLVRGMRSHDTSTCGLHVHVSRKNMHTMQINKMNVFLNHPDNHDLIKAVARRYDVNYARIAQKKLSNAHKYDIERRDALNITNDNTVEFRIFKGTLVHETLFSAIEFANAVVNFTMPASPAGFHLSTDRFLDFIDSPSQRSETKHLRKHLKAANIMS